MEKIIKFAFVGAVGFIVDSAMFMLCFHLCDFPIIVSRVVAFLFAATTTWIGNHWFTFHSNPNAAMALFLEWQRSMLSSCISAIPNFCVFMVMISILGSELPFIYISLLIGVLIGMCSNYWLSKKWVFNSVRGKNE